MTAEGRQDLVKRLAALQLKRVDVAQMLKEAIALGDLSENADYTEAKYQQGLCEGQIAELEIVLSNAEIVVDTGDISGGAGMFTTVTLLDLGFNDEFEYTLVPPFEADHRAGLISIESPIGEALTGKGDGDEVSVETPGGVSQFRVLSIRPRDAS